MTGIFHKPGFIRENTVNTSAGGSILFRLEISFKERGCLKWCSFINMSRSINFYFLYIRLTVISQTLKPVLSLRLHNFLFYAGPHENPAVLLFPAFFFFFFRSPSFFRISYSF